MDGDLITVIRSALELGTTGVVLVFVWVLWRAYQDAVQSQIAQLREENTRWRESFLARYEGRFAAARTGTVGVVGDAG